MRAETFFLILSYLAFGVQIFAFIKRRPVVGHHAMYACMAFGLASVWCGP